MSLKKIAIALLAIGLVAFGAPTLAQATDRPSDGPKKPTCDNKDCN